jgi:formate dehydrogenase subunit beta
MLVTDPAALANSAPLAPTLPFHSSTILKGLSSELEMPVAVVMKSCEIRASIELEKFQQTDLSNVIVVGVDCVGTYDVAEFASLSSDDRQLRFDNHITQYRTGTPKQIAENSVRSACARCLQPIPDQADLHVSLPAFRGDEVIGFTIGPRFAEAIRDAVGLEWSEDDDAEPDASAATKELLSLKETARATMIEELRATAGDPVGLTTLLSTCIRCHNCMSVCPICYCKECVFKSSVFERKANALLGLAKRKGAARMPADTLVFHLTRMSHMGTSCVSCGMCESACPSDIPVSSLFTMIGSELQTMFEYQPGASPDEEPPVKVFKEDELHAESGSGRDPGH